MDDRKKGGVMPLIAFLCSIASFVFACIGTVKYLECWNIDNRSVETLFSAMLVLSIPALICGIRSVKKNNNRPLAIAAIIISVVSLLAFFVCKVISMC